VEKLAGLLSQLERQFSRLNSADQKAVETSLSNLITLLRINGGEDSPAGSDSLSDIARYSTKKRLDLELASNSSPASAAALRQLRNEVIHGKSLKRIEYARAKKLEPILWRTLEASARLWNPNELSNFLTYCLRTEGPRLDPDHVEPKKLVRVYRAIYNTLDPADKERAFKELALRLFSEKRFVLALERGVVQ
jgi:hypothetical protein